MAMPPIEPGFVEDANSNGADILPSGNDVNVGFRNKSLCMNFGGNTVSMSYPSR